MENREKLNQVLLRIYSAVHKPGRSYGSLNLQQRRRKHEFPHFFIFDLLYFALALSKLEFKKC